MKKIVQSIHLKQTITVLLSNVLDHFDTALYSFLSPFIAPYLFPSEHPLIALVYTYALLPLNVLSKPLGAIVFGHLFVKVGRKNGLKWCLAGVGTFSFLLACLPFNQPKMAYYLLAAFRVAQSFFAAGFSAAGAVYLLENTHKKKSDVLSSFYSFSTMIGIILASFGVFLVHQSHAIIAGWRALYLLGALLTLAMLYFLNQQKEKNVLLPSITPFWLKKESLKSFLKIFFISGFDSANYYVSFLLISSAAAHINPTCADAMPSMNTALLCLDALLLPFFGWSAHILKRERQMKYAACIVMLFGPVFFFLFAKATLIQLFIFRAMILFFALMFCAPFHAFAFELVDPKERYGLIALATTLGSQLLGAPTVIISLAFYYYTSSVLALGIYWSFLAMISFFIFLKESLPRSVEKFSLIDHLNNHKLN